MDLRLEAAALSELGENTKDDPGFRVPSSTGSAPAATS
jgi:ubiquinone biosynthesis protein